MDTDPEHNTGYEDEKEPRSDSVYAEKADIVDYKAAAIEAENEEHNMTVLQAVKAYPMASFWAFVMSFCIVSCPSQSPQCSDLQLTPTDHGVVRRLPDQQLRRSPCVC